MYIHTSEYVYGQNNVTPGEHAESPERFVHREDSQGTDLGADRCRQPPHGIKVSKGKGGARPLVLLLAAVKDAGDGLRVFFVRSRAEDGVHQQTHVRANRLKRGRTITRHRGTTPVSSKAAKILET